jgi:hypothetical protein
MIKACGELLTGAPLLPDLVFELMHLQPVLKRYLQEQCNDLLVGHGHKAELSTEPSGTSTSGAYQYIIILQRTCEAPAG